MIDQLYAKQLDGDSNRIGISAATPKQAPQKVSTVGDRLLAVIELEIGRRLTCADCLGYLKTLNTQSTHNHDAIVKYLYAQFPWPHEWRSRHSNRYAVISALLADIVPVKNQLNLPQ